MKTISILGSTGVIGRLTVDVLQKLPETYRLRALAAGSNMTVLAQQIRTLQPECVAVAEESSRQALLADLADLPRIPEVLVGDEGLSVVADIPTDVVVSAIVGSKGLRPTWRALLRGATVALANKETLVAAGDLVMPLAAQHGATILPVDSEHSALFQCLQAGQQSEIGCYWITASGGPFRTWTSDALQHATIHDALKHPTWTMGQKITIDSATLMNKGLEVIEAHHLFAAAYDKIKVVVHPQSIVHSMIEYQDGSVLAQLGTHDMRGPIQYALTYPNRVEGVWPKLDLAAIGQLTFEEPDLQKFACLRLALAAGRAGGYAPSVLNAANEAAVAAALAERIRFSSIPAVVESVLEQHQSGTPHTVDDVLAMDEWARQRAEAIMKRGR